MRFRASLIKLLPLILLSSCALFRPVPNPAPAQPEAVPFAMNGRVSISHNGDKHNAGLHWTHRDSTDEILLLAPLGQTVGRVFREDHKATLDTDGKHYQADDVETLMQQVLGWHLPLDGLHYWVLGLTVDHSPAQIERGEDGRISVLYQDGWEVRYLRYEDTLPSRLQLSREDLRVQLLIDEWDWSPQ